MYKNVGLLLIIVCVFLSGQVLGNVSSCQKILGESKESKELCKKIGQMLIIGFGGFSQDEKGKVLWSDSHGTKFDRSSPIAKHIAEDYVGGVILFNQPLRDAKTEELLRDRNISGPVQLAKLNQDLQDYNSEVRKEQGLPLLPLFISVDQEGGRVDRMPAAQGFPVRTLVPQALGAKEEKGGGSVRGVVKSLFGMVMPDSCNEIASDAVQETYSYAKTLAEEIFAMHFNLNFAPVVDVNVNPSNPIIGGLGRSFSSDSMIVVDQARQFIRAFNGNGIIATLKHFPGHGSSAGDSHDGLVDVTKTYRRDIELEPYYTLIKDGYRDIVMTTHVINGNIDRSQCKAGAIDDHATWCPGTMSKKTLTDLLRNEMGFKGLVVSDDMTMGAIEKQYPLKVVLEKAVNAGVDIFIIANNKIDKTGEVITALASLIKSGAITREKIDEVYERIANFKKNKITIF